MAETVSFLDTTFKGLRCQNPVCQAEAIQEKRITLKNLLFTGWTCHFCGLVHEGAFADPDKIPLMGMSLDFDLAGKQSDEQVEEEIDKLAEEEVIIDDGAKKPSLKDRVLGKKEDADA